MIISITSNLQCIDTLILPLAQSKYLRNNATNAPLKGIDGIYLINLDRRPDRLARFKESSGLNLTDYYRFSAVDGATLRWSPELQRIFGKNKVNSRAALLACSISHIKLWRHIASTKNEMHLVFEDDAVFEEDWIKKWNREYYQDMPHNAFA